MPGFWQSNCQSRHYACKIFHQEVGGNFSARDFENVFEVFSVVQLNKCIICLAYQVQRSVP